MKEQRYRLKQLGWSLERYRTLNYAQGGLCYTCGEPGYGIALNADHDHDQKRARGLLCGSCNQAAGYLKDNPNVAKALAAYLELHGGLHD